MSFNKIVLFEDLFSEPLRNGLTRPKAVRGVGVKMVNMGELFAYSRIKNIPMDRVPLSDKEADKFLLNNGDLLFARQSLVRSGAGKCSIVMEQSEPITFESHLIRARLDKTKVFSPYYYYYFLSPIGRHLIDTIVEQVAAAGIRGSDLAKLPITLPPLSEQKAIAHILGTLDDKIELNQRMNRTLEAIARAIFKSWFIDFDPVRAKMEGRQPEGMSKEVANLFPDSFVDSELGMIPKGWKVGTVGDVAKNFCRAIKADNINPNTHYIGLEHMPRRSIALSDWGKAEDINSNKYKFYQGEILFGKLRPYFHKVGIAPFNGICSTDILVINPNIPEWLGFTLLIVSTDDFINYTDITSTGTRMPRTNWKNMS